MFGGERPETQGSTTSAAGPSPGWPSKASLRAAGHLNLKHMAYVYIYVYIYIHV